MRAIKQQRQDRISEILSILEGNGFIESIKTSSESTFYQVTDEGTYAYSKWVKDFLNFTRFSYNNVSENNKRLIANLA